MAETVPLSLGFETAAEKQRRSSPLRNAMLNNTPVVVAASAEDEAWLLLKAAAEIEHALLIQYLYAAISLRDTPRKTLINVAIQEMSHLLAVQNLLLFLGKSPYLARQDGAPNPDVDPFPFGLKSFQHKETLERFVLAEMPVMETLSHDEFAIIAEIRKRLDPDSKFHRVGVLYGRIYWLFQTSSAPEGDWKDVSNMADIGQLPQWHIGTFGGAATFATTQASRSEQGPRPDGNDGQIWFQDKSGDGAFGTIDSRETALRTIYAIAVQGEGLATPGTNSHYHTFFNTLKKHGQLGRSDFFAVPDNPGMSAGDGRTEVSDPLARAMCELLNNRYQILLVCLAAALRCSRTDAGENQRRQKLAFWAFFEMKFSIPTISAAIVGQPCKKDGDADELCAGPTFELADVNLSGDAAALETENRRLHIRARACIETLKLLGLGVDDDFVSQIAAVDHERYPDI